jgi:tripartite-type tricarboxylate transporter receptor subunit TctC
MRLLWTRRALGIVIAAAALTAGAQEAYPNRPIKLVVGFAPGGGGDSVARLVAEHIGRTLKQQVIVENRPGAGTTLAPAAVAAATPDGYTLLLAPDSVFGPDKVMWAPNAKYDETSFTPISKLASTFFVLAANKDFGVRTVAELMAKARADKGELFVASTQGLYPALIMENFNRASGLKLNQVPYKGGAPSVLAVVSGEVPVTFAVPSSVMPMVKDGKLVALAVTSANRSALTEGVPTLAESGMRGFDVGYWFGLAGPAGLPADITQKLFDAASAALADPAVKARLNTLGYEPAPSRSSSEFRSQAIQDGAALRKIVETLGIKGN